MKNCRRREIIIKLDKHKEKPEIDYTLYLVTDREMIGDRDLIEEVKKAVEGGVTLVQLREKGLPTRDSYHIARRLKEVLSEMDVPLLINDNVDIALAVDVDGVHLGDEDLPIDVARELLGRDKIIGRSVSDRDDAVRAEKMGADYLGLGPVYPTTTKEGADVGLDASTIDEVTGAVSIPVVGIGGIDADNIAEVAEYPFSGVAVVSAIMAKDDPRRAAKALKQGWNRAEKREEADR